MKKLGIIGAMEVENKIILDALKAEGKVKETNVGGTVYYEGSINSKEIVLARSGVGKVNAALCAQRMILQFGADFVVNSGIAGAIGKGLGVLDVVVSSDAIYHDMDVSAWGYKVGQIPQMDVYTFSADKKWLTRFKAFSRRCPKQRATSLRLAASLPATSLSRTRKSRPT